ncbi:hypothetical protein F9288_13755 [Sphingomonas sp. CL5.1]|uniref:hypothetical protein n=1 Tax=Sphingomonas sp. CL5.1 TaxID=2653203 RepID=UPI0015834DA3|nr:hypothetical protein [Sphingomonas sp. CL5.1]QKS00566.1 hypothetical protein F9288_13755 [Sphingomonas sp. CL5.1]
MKDILVSLAPRATRLHSPVLIEKERFARAMQLTIGEGYFRQWREEARAFVNGERRFLISKIGSQIRSRHFRANAGRICGTVAVAGVMSGNGTLGWP